MNRQSFLGNRNIFEILAENAAAFSDRDALIFLGDDDSESVFTYLQLAELSRTYGESFNRAGLSKGDILMLLLPHSPETIFSFWGGISSGVVTSIYPYPLMGIDKSKSAGIIKNTLRRIKARAVLTTPDLAGELLDTGCAVLQIAEGRPEQVSAISDSLDAVRLDSRIAYLQLTSGTTGSSKGVLISHRNILYFLEALAANQSGVFKCRANWTPLYHTAALMGAVVTSLAEGITLVLRSPSSWLLRPLSFFQAVERYQAEKITMPNSGFVYAFKYIDDRELEKLDLSCLREVLAGGEPVGAEIIERFFIKFARAGLRRSSFSNAYGQAEATALISQSFTRNGEITVDHIEAGLFFKEGIARRVMSGYTGRSLAIVSCGRPAPGLELKIVDDEARELPERKTGEVLVRGGVVFQGYHLDQELTERTIRDGWLCTGDIGYLVEGELYICDRKKDLIITGGKNVRPGDIEGIIYDNFPDCALSAAFGVFNQDIGTEQVILACEWTRPLAPREEMEVEKMARKLIFSNLSIGLDDFRIVARNWIVRTATGKISRGKTANRYREESQI